MGYKIVEISEDYLETYDKEIISVLTSKLEKISTGLCSLFGPITINKWKLTCLVKEGKKYERQKQFRTK